MTERFSSTLPRESGEDLFWSGGVFEERLYSLISESLNKIPEAYVFFLTEVGGGDCG